ncbi:rhodanese-like domain-containing protein [Pseudokineococcus sp. 1T1Z-3]|uniref:rhodanese-like domain-containing protein n=1 Tax=Pseudokineococcus sp. 1T1Z-3 TaxID=3132745 RepID=UPI0030B132D0
MTTVTPMTASPLTANPLTANPMTATVPAARTPGATRTDAARLVADLRRQRPVTLLDVRSAAEFESAHVEGAVNVPLDLLTRDAGPVAARLRGDVVVMCAAGARAERARQLLVAAGTGATLQVLGGGTADVASAGGTVVEGRARWAMDRQVRLAAGSLVLTGMLVGLAVPAARLLAGGVAAGLTVSALTNTCPMARALALLPHNCGAATPTTAQVLAQLP